RGPIHRADPNTRARAVIVECCERRGGGWCVSLSAGSARLRRRNRHQRRTPGHCAGSVISWLMILPCGSTFLRSATTIRISPWAFAAPVLLPTHRRPLSSASFASFADLKVHTRTSSLFTVPLAQSVPTSVLAAVSADG